EDHHVELYNLQSDISETNDLSSKHEDLAHEMRNKLLTWLKEMNTQYAEVDPLWDETAWNQRLVNHRNKLMPRLEKQRKAMLDSTWQPNEDWWGSEIMKSESDEK
ncbi:hypothetical protein, partial [Paraglaciecola sp.]|uniref:hypothetical protein n=1 Tax=Paraglaciecola sp. TaxID=1920173 RepID=UPI003EF99B86